MPVPHPPSARASSASSGIVRRPRPAAPIACAVTIIALSAQGAHSDGPGHGSEPASPPQLTLFIENDLVVNSDDNYTSGVGLSWISADVSQREDDGFVSQWLRAFSFLPGLDEESYRRSLSLTLGQEIYTPNDIESPIPPPGQQPYVGVLYVDAALYAHGPRSMHEYTIRVGCTGPCSGAEAAQTWIHEQLDRPIPQGWDTQLDTELLLGFAYEYHRRLLRRENGGHSYDVATHAGGSFGNYFTGVDLGISTRYGLNLPDTYGVATLRTGGASRFVGLTPAPGSQWRAYAFLALEGYGIVRFLPTDGSNFRPGPSVDRDSLVANLIGGFVVGRGRFQVSWTYNGLVGFRELPSGRSQDFGTLALGYSF